MDPFQKRFDSIRFADEGQIRDEVRNKDKDQFAFFLLLTFSFQHVRDCCCAVVMLAAVILHAVSSSDLSYRYEIVCSTTVLTRLATGS